MKGIIKRYMMKIKSILEEWLFNLPIFEMAYERREALNQIENLNYQIDLHLVKILTVDISHETKSHWLTELNAWLRKINNIKIKGKRPKFVKDVYYKHLFIHLLGDLDSFRNILNDIRIDNPNYVFVDEPYEESYKKTEHVLNAICHDIANYKFNSIFDYIKHNGELI